MLSLRAWALPCGGRRLRDARLLSWLDGGRRKWGSWLGCGALDWSVLL